VWLTLEELRAVDAGYQIDWQALVRERKATHAREQRRTLLPDLLLGDGRAFYSGGGMDEDVADATTLHGQPVSAGSVEGICHVVLQPHNASLAHGEILVCPATDPAWTPLFLSAGGLVMETGGMMTHGSVVAREYGIPAVVGVRNATTRLVTGMRVRVNGSTGVITVLPTE
jgi:pyruvate,water dikinase